MPRLREAADFDKDLHESGGTTFPLVPAEGDMLAFFDLLSQGKLDLSVDTSGLSAKALDYTDFGTRQASASLLLLSLPLCAPSSARLLTPLSLPARRR